MSDQTPTPKEVAETAGQEAAQPPAAPETPAQPAETPKTETPSAKEAAKPDGEQAGKEENSEGTSKEPDWKAEARKHEKRAKENYQRNQQLEKELNELKAEKQKTDDAAQLRSDVAEEKGVPAHLLQGETREEMEEQADALIAFIGSSKQPTGPLVPEAGSGSDQPLDSEAEEALKALGFA
ncbi:hypothetical protein [Nesterenkonia rhizosphaerae]|uniref:Scaffolding protein n=1 Tax=Nesterenkonia rhizosphaerae TaxID=1348272 RepID=A0ABP9FZK3_9MICC